MFIFGIYIAISTAFCAAADRFRGSSDPKAVAQMVYGVVALLLLTPMLGNYPFYAGGLFVALFVAGSAPGYGQPVGNFLSYGATENSDQWKGDFEWWQKGPLQENLLYALIARGALWGIAVLPTAIWFGSSILLVTLAMTVAFPLAAIIARKVWLADKEKWGNKRRWNLMEYIRGGLFGAIIAIVVVVTLTQSELSLFGALAAAGW